MQRPEPETITLNDVLITEALFKRASRQPNLQAENQAMRSLAQQMAQDSQRLMQTLANTALELCQAGTAGVSLLEATADGAEIFRWVVLAGTLAHHVGGSTPRNFSPCGVCLDRGTPVLFSHPASYFTYFQEVNIPFVEGLVLPLVADEHTLGTIWILSHDEQRQFDSEDVRIMTSLADFTAAALLLNQRQTKELLAANVTLEVNVEEHRQTEAQLQALISNLPGGAAFVVDRDLRYLLAEGAALAIAGFKPEDLIGKTIAEAMPPELVSHHESLYQKGLAGEPFEHEHTAHDRFYVSRGTPLRSAEGEVYAVLAVSYDITDRKRVEDEHKQAEAAIAADLRDTQLLHDLSARLVTEGDIQTLYQEIMAAAIALTRADAGTVQILDEATQDLVLLATQGFERDLTDHFYRVNASSNTSCGRALVTGDRTFIDFDVPESEDPDGSMRIHVAAGYLSAQSTPLIARSGKAIGMVSTHWRKHHRPTERELRFLDLLARQAADLIEQRQAQQVIQESEALLQKAFSTETVGVLFFSLDGRMTGANETFVRWSGYSHDELLQVNWEALTPPEFVDVTARAAGELAAQGETAPYEKQMIRKDGSRWWGLFAPTRLTGSGSASECVEFIIDISDRKRVEDERKRREANLTFLADLMNDFAPLVTAEEVMEMVGSRITEHLDLSRYMFVEIFPEAGTCTYLLPSHPPGQLEISGSFVLADYHTEEEHRLLCTGHSMIVNDVRDGTRTPEQIAAFEMFDISSIVNTPYVSNGRWVFDLGVARSTPSVWREDEIELLRELSARIWLRIERARAEADLRKSEAKYRSLFNSIDEGFCLFEMIYDETERAVDYRFLEVNPAFERQTGLKNVVGKLGSEIAPNTERYWLETYDQVLKTGNPQRIENYNQATNRWYSAYASRIGDADRRQVCTVFSDITDRKHYEQRQAYLLQLSDALRSLSDAVEIHAAVTNIALNFFEADRCCYCEIIDGNAIIRRDASRKGLPSVVGVYPLSDFPIFKAVIDAGHPLVVEDAQTTDILDETLRQLCYEMQVISFINVPVIKEGEPIGAFCITQSLPRNWSALETELAQETAERIWAAVERSRSEAALRESEIQRVREQAAREEERQRAEALTELDRAKTTFFSNISHEFRTPLTLSLAPLQDALKIVDEWMSNGVDEWESRRVGEWETTDDLSPHLPISPSPHLPISPSPHLPIPPSTLKQNLELVHRNSLRLLKLVNTLLDFSRIEAGRMEAVYEPTDLATFTAELASVFRSAIERASLQLIVDCPPLPQPVFVDREMWEKIVLNLLSNAFKFTFEGAITVKLRPTDGNQALLQIQDTGTGIAPEHLPHLFERFYQVRGTQARTHEGSGIGLALVHELVRLHDGTIEVSSTVGEGTCFTITLPFGTDHLPSARLRRGEAGHLQDKGDRIQPTRTLASTAMGASSYVEEAEHWLSGSSYEFSVSNDELGNPATQNSKLKTQNSLVLLVDDNADMREYLTRILSEHVQVEAVADGATALAVAQKRVPDLILSDVMMPGLDGFELLGALRANPQTREVPIILLSARAGEEAIVEGLEAGADDYLIKPFSAQELVSRVIAHLQMAQLRREALQEARSTLRSRDEFISVVSHELNTPLVSILGWTRMLRSSPPNPVMLSKALDTIERNATLQGKLVQDLLDLSRITASKLRLNLQPIELQPVIETAIATVTQTAADKGIQLTWQENVTDPVVVMGDGDRLQQVICNLLTNAIKFTPESGSVTLELSVTKNDSSADTSYAEIRVIDSGSGIAADFLPHVFDRFRQAEGANAAEGLGLGLAIARHIVELHDGTIRAESAGLGATFTVRLPLFQRSDDFI